MSEHNLFFHIDTHTKIMLVKSLDEDTTEAELEAALQIIAYLLTSGTEIEPPPNDLSTN